MESKEGRKTKEKYRKEVSDIYAELELKNDEYQKIKVQLERESEHFFTKEF